MPPWESVMLSGAEFPLYFVVGGDAGLGEQAAEG